MALLLRAAKGSLLTIAEMDANLTYLDSKVAATPAVGTQTVYLSRAGCVSDADISIGSITYGTDNTAAIQAVLDRASETQPLEVVWDGGYSITGLKYHSNTLIRALSGCGAILRPNSNKALLASATESATAFLTHDVAIEGGYWNANSYDGTGFIQLHDTAGDPTFGMRFRGVRNICLRNVTLVKQRTWAFSFYNVENVLLDRIKIDIGSSSQINMDGIHFNGPARNLVIRNLDSNCYDDNLAFNAEETVPEGNGYVSGPITDVEVDGVFLHESSLFGIRVFSGASRIDRMSIRNVHGATRGYWLIVDNYLQDPSATGVTSHGAGNVGALTLENIHVACTLAILPYVKAEAMAMISTNVETLVIKNYRRDFFAGAGFPMLRLAGGHTIENLTLDGFYARDTSAFANYMVLNEGCTVGLLDIRSVHLLRTQAPNGSCVVMNAQGTNYQGTVTTGTITTLHLNGAVVNGANCVVRNEGGVVQDLSVLNVSHYNAGGGASFTNTGASVDMLLYNYRGAMISTGTFATHTTGISLIAPPSATIVAPVQVGFADARLTYARLDGGTWGGNATTRSTNIVGATVTSTSCTATRIYVGITTAPEGGTADLLVDGTVVKSMNFVSAAYANVEFLYDMVSVQTHQSITLKVTNTGVTYFTYLRFE